MGMATADSEFHVLAVDDSLIDRKLIERLLKNSSFQVTTVDSGSKALEFLGWHEHERSYNSNETSVSPKSHQEMEVHLVITDYCMPEMTGYDLLKKMKESSSLRNIPVVIMSSENVPSRITSCLEEGAEEFFLKPMKLSDVNKLRSHMMKSKCNNIQKPEKLEKQESTKEITQATTHEEATTSEEIQLQTTQSLQQQQQQLQQTPQTSGNNNNNNNNNNKRKTIDDGLPPDMTRPIYNGLTVMSN